MANTKTLFPIVLLLASLSCSDDSVRESNPIDVEESVHLIDDTLLFSKNPEGHNELYKLEKGVESVVLSDPDYDFWWPKVSPDKTKFLVYRSVANPDKNHDDYQNAELVLANIDGSNPQVLISKNENGWNAQGVCRWNKDGTKILMCAEVETGSGFQWRLITTDSMGENPKVISDRWAIDCNYSIDNANIVFMGYPENKLSLDFTKLELQRGDYDAVKDTLANITSLTNNDSRDHDPDFSPDNKKIVFSAGNSGYDNVDLAIYDVASKTESVLFDDNSANGGSMCWSADGKYIFFHSLEVLKSPFRIKCINVATRTNETILETADNGHGFYHPEAY